MEKKRVLIIVIAAAAATIFLHILVMSAAASESGEMQGTASWYGHESPGILKTTANMETFNENTLTCATWHFPFGTYLKVTNLENGKSIIVRVNDRGPARRYVAEGRVIDLTKMAFSRIADLDKGLIRTKVEEVVK